MNPTLYRCECCGTVTDRPDWSDASREVLDDNGYLNWLRVHLAVCPQCHRALKAFAATAQALHDIQHQPKH
jgi:hypothetical protein